MPRSGYASHLPILAVVRDYLQATDAIEFGCGLYSTPWLLSFCERLTTIELNEKWLDEMKKAIEPKLQARWRPYLVQDEMAAMRDGTNKVYACDLIMVDGGNEKARHHVVQECMNCALSPAILMHDAERACYQYNEMTLPAGWYYVRTQGEIPWTAVVTKDKNLIALMTGIWNCSICPTTQALSTISYPSIPSYNEQQAQLPKCD